MYLRTAAATAALTAAVCLPASAAAHAVPTGPGGPDKDCSDFDTQLEAQLVLKENPLDFFRLDRDEDGIACEGLPGTKVGTPTGPASVVPLPPATQRPTGAVPAGAGGTAAGPDEVLLPLGLALTALAVSGGIVITALRKRRGDAGG